MKAVLRDIILADSTETVLLGTERYFPAESVRTELLTLNGRKRFCHWKGHGVCYDVIVNGEVFHDGAWSYPHPFWEAAEAKGMIAFAQPIVIME